MEQHRTKPIFDAFYHLRSDNSWSKYKMTNNAIFRLGLHVYITMAFPLTSYHSENVMFLLLTNL